MWKRVWRLCCNRITLGVLIGILLIILLRIGIVRTSSDEFCESCHVHPHSTTSWRLSSHYNNASGIVVHCVECHLPPGGFAYYREKIRLGIQDIWGKLVKDGNSFNWELKSRLEHAQTFTYKESCIRCHQNLFPLQLSKKGEEAHLHYRRNEKRLRCLNCHLNVGHYTEKPQTAMFAGSKEMKSRETYRKPARVTRFEDFTEFIPGTSVSFRMVAIPGGTFDMGSPESEPYRDADEGPVRRVQISPFWMGEVEVTWDEYWVFYEQTSTEGKTGDQGKARMKLGTLDAITGATPPYGNPDQGWGRGKRPAITMTYHAAQVYCQWLSKVTGKRYRLPTEAEWEYACRGGTQMPYFFSGDPRSFTSKRWWNRITGPDTTTISRYVIYAANSQGKTQPPETVQPNPFGLKNMLGNVWEFCLDNYSPSLFPDAKGTDPLRDPVFLDGSDVHVIRGGSFTSDAADVRCAVRDSTHNWQWLLTDPQIPKSKWWYSDCIDVGFRIVCEVDSSILIEQAK